jgi:hypothetical protein
MVLNFVVMAPNLHAMQVYTENNLQEYIIKFFKTLKRPACRDKCLKEAGVYNEFNVQLRPLTT